MVLPGCQVAGRYVDPQNGVPIRASKVEELVPDEGQWDFQGPMKRIPMGRTHWHIHRNMNLPLIFMVFM